MRYSKYCPAYKDGICLGSICAGRKMMRCEEILSENICDWFEAKYIDYLISLQSIPKVETHDGVSLHSIIADIIRNNLGHTHCVTCERIGNRDDRCNRCESYWELDEYTLEQIVDKIIKAIEE